MRVNGTRINAVLVCNTYVGWNDDVSEHCHLHHGLEQISRSLGEGHSVRVARAQLWVIGRVVRGSVIV